MHTLADWYFINSSIFVITSIECEIRVNEPRDFTKIACVRSRDFSGPDQSSVTMADKNKGTYGEVFRVIHCGMVDDTNQIRKCSNLHRVFHHGMETRWLVFQFCL